MGHAQVPISWPDTRVPLHTDRSARLVEQKAHGKCQHEQCSHQHNHRCEEVMKYVENDEDCRGREERGNRVVCLFQSSLSFFVFVFCPSLFSTGIRGGGIRESQPNRKDKKHKHNDSRRSRYSKEDEEKMKFRIVSYGLRRTRKGEEEHAIVVRAVAKRARLLINHHDKSDAEAHLQCHCYCMQPEREPANVPLSKTDEEGGVGSEPKTRDDNKA